MAAAEVGCAGKRRPETAGGGSAANFAAPQRQYEITGGIIDHALYDTLLKFKGADVSHPLPDVAASFKASSDAKTYTFQLRKNVKFSDGTPLTSTDVVFSFRRLVNLKGNPSFLLAGITTSAKGPYTVVLKSKTPNPAIPVLVANTSLGVVNSKVVKAHGGSDAVGRRQDGQGRGVHQHALRGQRPVRPEVVQHDLAGRDDGEPDVLGPEAEVPDGRPAQRLGRHAAPRRAARHERDLARPLARPGDVLKGNSKLQVAETPSANVFFLFANHNAARSRRPRSNPHFQNAIRYGARLQRPVSLAGSGAVQAAGIVPSMFLGSLPASAAAQAGPGQGQGRGHGVGHREPDGEPRVPERHHLERPLSSACSPRGSQSDLGKIGITAKLTGARSPRRSALPRRHRAARPVVLGPGLSGPERLPRVPPGRDGRPARRLAGRCRPDARGARDEGRRDRRPGQARSRFRQIQNQLNASGPFFPLIQPGQVMVASKNLTDVVFNVLYWIDVAAIGTR